MGKKRQRKYRKEGGRGREEHAGGGRGRRGGEQVEILNLLSQISGYAVNIQTPIIFYYALREHPKSNSIFNNIRKNNRFKNNINKVQDVCTPWKVHEHC